MSEREMHPNIAILIPCLNEEQTVRQVIEDFRAQLPDADIYVFDNASTDRTTEIARTAGAIVTFEGRRGKGFVVQSMFEKVDADLYVMVDGDSTYPADQVHALIAPVLAGKADMAVGSRITAGSQSKFRLLNLMGNKLYMYLINIIFHTKLTDILSGYRCMNRRFVKSLPLFFTGFEVEAELTIKALDRGFQIYETPINLKDRPEGSSSKIHLLRDGWRILATILSLFRDYKPLTFFGFVGLLAIILGLLPGLIVMREYYETGVVRNLPISILAVFLLMGGGMLLAIGLILHTMKRRFQELEHYLRILTHQSQDRKD